MESGLSVVTLTRVGSIGLFREGVEYLKKVYKGGRIEAMIMMSIDLKTLAVFYGYGALIHIADLLNLGHYLGQSHGFTFAQMPLAWKTATVYFTIFNTIAAIGLWKGALWGMACFLLAAASQVVMYTALTEIFTKQPGLVVFHLLMVGLYMLLRV